MRTGICYNLGMRQAKHWSVDEERFKARNPEGYRRWQIEQRVNLSVGRWKLNRAELKRLWPKLKLDADMQNILAFYLWPDSPERRPSEEAIRAARAAAAAGRRNFGPNVFGAIRNGPKSDPSDEMMRT